MTRRGKRLRTDKPGGADIKLVPLRLDSQRTDLSPRICREQGLVNFNAVIVANDCFEKPQITKAGDRDIG